jgi:hypothetical protein
MGIKKEFINISEKLNAEYYYENYKVSEPTPGSRIFISDHYFKITHKKLKINAKYNLGSNNMAELNSDIEINNAIPELKMETRDNFTRLITFKKDIWKIKCSDKFFRSKLIHLLNQSKLTEIAEKTAFEPLISLKQADNICNINIKYNLGFNDKEKYLITIINFHKKFIDLIQEHR